MDNVNNIKNKVFNCNYISNPSSKQVIRALETCCDSNFAVFDIDKIFPLQQAQFENITVPIPADPLMHLYQSTEYGNYGDVMNFPTIKDSGFLHTQALHAKEPEYYNNILVEISNLNKQIGARL